MCLPSRNCYSMKAREIGCPVVYGQLMRFLTWQCNHPADFLLVEKVNEPTKNISSLHCTIRKCSQFQNCSVGSCCVKSTNNRSRSQKFVCVHHIPGILATTHCIILLFQALNIVSNAVSCQLRVYKYFINQLSTFNYIHKIIVPRVNTADGKLCM